MPRSKTTAARRAAHDLALGYTPVKQADPEAARAMANFKPLVLPPPPPRRPGAEIAARLPSRVGDRLIERGQPEEVE